MPSKKLWAYIAKLEKVIKSTMESSEEIAELVEKIQREGVEVSLNCIALFSDPEGRSFAGPNAEAAAAALGGHKAIDPKKKPGRKKKTPETTSTSKAGGKAAAGKGKGKAKPEFKVTDADREFLRQIGIRFD